MDAVQIEITENRGDIEDWLDMDDWGADDVERWVGQYVSAIRTGMQEFYPQAEITVEAITNAPSTCNCSNLEMEDEVQETLVAVGVQLTNFNWMK